MTPDAKKQLAASIRSLRTRLLDDLHDALESQYRLSVKPQDSGLSEANLIHRNRFESWMHEQLRAEGATNSRSLQHFRKEAEKEAAYTWLNRLVILRIMESTAIRSSKVLTGGWDSSGYKDFRALAPDLVRGDDTEGYAFLLNLIFQDLEVEMPGVYGRSGIADLVPMPASTLRHLVEELDAPELSTCWTDDMTLGWVYQYWNDPERELLDDKLNDGGKIEPYEIASKTQIFTERYMVEWLLQNSLGNIWLSICKQHDWTPAVRAQGTFETLEKKRSDWRRKRESGEVSRTDLMPLTSALENRWAYHCCETLATQYVPQSVREVKILDPAVGSGHFLVVAFDLLFAMYQEEAKLKKEEHLPEWSVQSIAESILERNLYGIDLDPRAVQIAAASVWLKAKQTCSNMRPCQLNLVASNLRIAGLPDDDPALVELRREMEAETGIPLDLTNTIIHALRGADYLGSLLKVDAVVDNAIRQYESGLGRRNTSQRNVLLDSDEQTDSNSDRRTAVKSKTLELIESFLKKHTSADDLGLRLRGEQLAAGVRFVRYTRENSYDLVVANPPYQGTRKMADDTYVDNTYAEGKSDLFAAFLMRGLQLVRDGGISAMVTMRNWMFLKDYESLRGLFFENFDLKAIGDFDRGAFETLAAGPAGVSVALSVWQKTKTDTKSMLCAQARSVL